MKFSKTFQAAFVGFLFSAGAAVSAHVVLEEPAALAGRSYRAVFRLGHGCDGSPTTAISIAIPAGFKGAKPMPKPGWVLTTKSTKLDKPYDDHGVQVTEAVSEITWTAASRGSWLPDAWYDEFVLRGGLPATAGAIWFKVLQTCEKGSKNWAEVPASGISVKGLKSPAAVLDVVESSPAAGHQH
jgi:uncharacterized protein YcnI